MRIGMRSAAVLIGIAALGVLSFAQDPAGGGPGGGGQGRGFRQQFGRGNMGMMGLLNMPDVQLELKLTQEQKDEIAKLRPARGGRRGAGGPGGEPGGPGGDPGGGPPAPPADQKKLEDILNKDQMARLKELNLQFMGANAISNNQELQRDLGLSEEQVNKINDIQQEAMEAMRDEMQAMRDSGQQPDFQAMQKRMQEMQTKNGKKFEAVLTAAQKAKFEKMKGKPFTFKNRDMIGPGAGRRGGGGAPGPGGGGGAPTKTDDGG